MGNYDSILKEKKTYREEIPTKKNKVKKFPWLLLDIICLILILIISYIIYFQTILTPKNIFLNDLKIVSDKYTPIMKNLNIDQIIKDSYNSVGTITLNEQIYKFNLAKEKNIKKLDLSLNEQNLIYYEKENESYINLSTLNDTYYKLSNNNYSNILNNIKTYLKDTLKEEDFIKKFYLNKMIVESNLVLDNSAIKKALNINSKNTYEALITFKNNAITNEIISLKVVINNQITNKRFVIIYEDEVLTYKDDNKTLTFKLEEKNKDFTLKIYQNNILYSVLAGTSSEKSYQYTYQIIDKIYNITLKTTSNANSYTYEVTSTIEEDKIIKNQTLELILNYQENSSFESINLSNAINYNTLNEEEKNSYNIALDTIINPLRKFIQKYKNSIN